MVISGDKTEETINHIDHSISCISNLIRMGKARSFLRLI